MEQDSEDYTTDEEKRKAEDEDYIFKKAKKIQRTPQKHSASSHDMMTKMINLMTDLAAGVKEIKAEQHTHGGAMKILKKEIKELREEHKEYRSEIKKLKEVNEKAMSEIDHLKNKVETVKGRLVKLETGGVLRQIMVNVLEKDMGVIVKANAVRRLGERTCLIELNSRDDKVKVMQSKNKLKYLKEKIYINDDLTKEERDIQTTIRNRAKEEKSKGKNIKVAYQKLIVNNEIWKWDKEKGIGRKLENYKPTN